MLSFQTRTLSTLAATAVFVSGVLSVTMTLAGPPPGPKSVNNTVVLDRVIYVSGAGPIASNGVALLDAVAEIGVSGPCADVPSILLPCLIQLGPGIYDVSGSIVELPPFVSLAGSGRTNTTIRGDAGTGEVVDVGGSNTEIRDLTVEMFDGTVALIGAVAISNSGTNGNLRISRVTAHAAAEFGTGGLTGIFVGGNGTNAVLTDVEATAAGPQGIDAGIGVGGTNVVVEMHNVHASAERGLIVSNTATVTAFSSAFIGTTQSVFVGNGSDIASASIHGSQLAGNLRAQANSDLAIATSQIDGAVDDDPQATGTVSCIFDYTPDFVALTFSCDIPS